MEFGVGDMVVATRDGGHDRQGLPIERPRAGKMYRISSIYEMAYGLGCTLEGLDPRPYKGYFLHVNKGKNAGWYFKPVEVADPEFTATLRQYLAETGVGERL
jgi:hypothetical protein